MSRSNGSVSNVSWYVVIIVTFILLAYCAFPAFSRKESRKEFVMLEFIQEILMKNGMTMTKGKSYEYDFEKNALIIRDL